MGMFTHGQRVVCKEQVAVKWECVHSTWEGAGDACRKHGLQMQSLYRFGRQQGDRGIASLAEGSEFLVQDFGVDGALQFVERISEQQSGSWVGSFVDSQQFVLNIEASEFHKLAADVNQARAQLQEERDKSGSGGALQAGEGRCGRERKTACPRGRAELLGRGPLRGRCGEATRKSRARAWQGSEVNNKA